MPRRLQSADRDLRVSILTATRGLLDERPFDQIAVADILTAAGISRGSFYFYFESKQDVLAELVRQAIAEGHAASESWLGRGPGEDDRRAATRRSIADGARLWAEQAPVLRAIVENWRTDPKLTELWSELMAGFTRVTAEQIDADRAAGVITHRAIDSETLGATLTWLGERLYYLAALGQAPFDDQEKLTDVLTHIWMSALYTPEQP
ncbi:TetR/AcrR family transcriptional regulator [Actinomadura darangshiensis]|uniref:TetR/AcrR family transcriptional regulator n=2 Tax=Actinomadura darangshiensis TaxID=705336 RepID=A0A4R5A3P6_9ACTN|nr:TetR/AcrR family transcriptional regulator [Actinomadura darangshiensis]